MNLAAEVDLLDDRVPADLRQYLLWEFNSPHFKILNSCVVRVGKWFKVGGEPQDYAAGHQPIYKLWVVHNGVLMIHENSFSHYDSGYAMTTERVYFITAEITVV